MRGPDKSPYDKNICLNVCHDKSSQDHIYTLGRLPFKVSALEDQQNLLKTSAVSNVEPEKSFLLKLWNLFYHSFSLPQNISPKKRSYYDDVFTLPFRFIQLNTFQYLMILFTFLLLLANIFEAWRHIDVEIILKICLCVANILICSVGIFFSSYKKDSWCNFKDRDENFFNLITGVKYRLRFSAMTALFSSLILVIINLPLMLKSSIFNSIDNRMVSRHAYFPFLTFLDKCPLDRVNEESLIRLLNESNGTRFIVSFSKLFDYLISSLDEGLWSIILVTIMIHVCFRGILSTSTRTIIVIILPFLHCCIMAMKFYRLTKILADGQDGSNGRSQRQESANINSCTIEDVVALKPLSLWSSQIFNVIVSSFVSNILLVCLAQFIGTTLSQWIECQLWRLLFVLEKSHLEKTKVDNIGNNLTNIAETLVPKTISNDLVKDLKDYYSEWSSPLVIYLKNVSFISIEIVGLNQMISKMPPPNSTINSDISSNEISLAIEEIYKIFDSMANEHGCYCVRRELDEYLCVAGYPETRVDHARSCLEFALALNKFSVCIQDTIKHPFHLSIAVNTGSAFAAVLGQSRLSFDLIGSDIMIVERMRFLCKPNRILVTRGTFEQLPEGYRGEIGPNISLFNQALIQTFYVQTRNSKHLKNQFENCFPYNEALTRENYFAKLLRTFQEYNIRKNTDFSGGNLLFGLLNDAELCERISRKIRHDNLLDNELSMVNQLTQAGFSLSSQITKEITANREYLSNLSASFKETLNNDRTQRSVEDFDLYQLKWPCSSPNGLLEPNWLTLAFHTKSSDRLQIGRNIDYKNLSFELKNKPSVDNNVWHTSDIDRAETMKSLEEHVYHQSQRPRLIASTVLVSLVILTITFIVQLLLMPRSSLFIIFNSLAFFFLIFILTYITIQRLKFSYKSLLVRIYGIRVFILVTSLILVLLSNQINLFSCKFGIWTQLLSQKGYESATSGNLLIIMNSNQDKDPMQTSTTSIMEFCPLPGYIILIGCILCLLPIIICPPPTISQSLRIGFSFAILTIQIITMTFMFSANNGHSSILIFGCIALISFTLVTIFLPRILDLLNRLTYLWKLQHGFDSIDYRGCLDGLCRVILSIIPKHVALFIFDTNYVNPLSMNSFYDGNSWLIIMGLNISFNEKAANKANSDTESIDPSLYADNVRRLNQFISMIDFLTNYGDRPLNSRESMGSKLFKELTTCDGESIRKNDLVRNSRFRGIIKVAQYGSNVCFGVGLTNKNLTPEKKAELVQISLRFIQNLLYLADKMNKLYTNNDDLILNFMIDCDSSITSVHSNRRITFNLWSSSMTLMRILTSSVLPVDEKKTEHSPESRIIITNKVFSLINSHSSSHILPSEVSNLQWMEYNIRSKTLTNATEQVYMNHGPDDQASSNDISNLYIWTETQDERYIRSCLANIVDLMKMRNFVMSQKAQKRGAKAAKNNSHAVSCYNPETKLNEAMLISNQSLNNVSILNQPATPPQPPPHQRSYEKKAATTTSQAPPIPIARLNHDQHSCNANPDGPLLNVQSLAPAQSPILKACHNTDPPGEDHLYSNMKANCMQKNENEPASIMVNDSRLNSSNSMTPVTRFHQQQIEFISQAQSIKPKNPFIMNEDGLPNSGNEINGLDHKSNQASSTSSTSVDHQLMVVDKGDRNNNNKPNHLNASKKDRSSNGNNTQTNGISHHNPLYTDNEYDSMGENNNDGFTQKERSRFSKNHKPKKEDEIYNGPVSIIAHAPSEMNYQNNDYNGFSTDCVEDISELEDNLSLCNEDNHLKQSFLKDHLLDQQLINFQEKIISKINGNFTFENDPIQHGNVEEDEEDIFAYHNGKGNGFSFGKNNKLLAMATNQIINGDQYLEPKDIDRDYCAPINGSEKFVNDFGSCLTSDNGPMVNNVPCVIHLSNGPAHGTGNETANYLTNGSNHTAISEYDNVTRKSSRHAKATLSNVKSRRNFSKPSLRKLLVVNAQNDPHGQRRNNKRKKFFTPNQINGEESDTMSGYNGDASVYNSDEDNASDENIPKLDSKPSQKGKTSRGGRLRSKIASKANDFMNSIGRKSDYENVVDSEVYVNEDSKKTSSQRIAEEAKKITQNLQYIELSHDHFDDVMKLSKKEMVLVRNSGSSQEEDKKKDSAVKNGTRSHAIQTTNYQLPNNNSPATHQPGLINKSNKHYRHSVIDPWSAKHLASSQGLLRGKSLSTICLMSGIDEQKKDGEMVNSRTSRLFQKNNKKLVLLRNRADKVRSLLPPSLAQFVLPGCVSSLSGSSSSANNSSSSLDSVDKSRHDLSHTNSLPLRRKRSLSNPTIA